MKNDQQKSPSSGCEEDNQWWRGPVNLRTGDWGERNQDGGKG
jgi:hypothetical protein